jgi:hypothetical protein
MYLRLVNKVSQHDAEGHQQQRGLVDTVSAFNVCSMI